MCRALFPRVLRTLLSRVAIFKEYSVSFEEFGGEQLCIVRTWEEDALLEVCINVEDVGQRVPDAELSSLSRIVCSCGGELMPLSIRGGPQSFLRMLSDNRTDGRLFVYCREFTSEVFLQCYRQAHQEIFGMLEVATMVDFLMLRLRPALQEPWLEDLVTLRRCVLAGAVTFVDLRAVIRELRSVWESMREYVRYTGPQHVKSSFDKVRLLHYFYYFFFVYMSSSLYGG